jgi:hypothetical protein
LKGLLVSIALVAVMVTAACSPKPVNLHLTPVEWRDDIDDFAQELPRRHANALRYISRERFNAEIAALQESLGSRDGDAVYVGLDRIANLVGDAHTYIKFPADNANLPIDIRQFGNDSRVVAVAPGYEAALGARVLQVQDTPVAKARELILSLTPQEENSSLQQSRIDGFLTVGMVLHGLGITPDRNVARYTLAGEDGRTFTLEVHALPPTAPDPRWIYPCSEPPLYRQQPGKSFWYAYLAATRTLYCQFRGYDGLREQARGLLKEAGDRHPDKLVIDLRQNYGGDYTEGLKYMIRPIRDLPASNLKGHLFVLIGTNTFSAGMNNAAQFRTETAAMLVGEMIGERPNSYQEPREFTLPNSHLVVRYSTRFYRFGGSGENAIRPDHEVTTSWDDYKSCRDPVLDWVLQCRTE